MEDVREPWKNYFYTSNNMHQLDLRPSPAVTYHHCENLKGCVFFLSPLHWKNHALRDTFPIHHMKDHQLALLYNKKSHNLNHAY